MTEPLIEQHGIEQHGIRERVLTIAGRIVGYQLEPDAEQLGDLDSLQILEFLVLLEEEFDVDSDKIVETPGWWMSLDGIVTSIQTLTGDEPAREQQSRAN